MAEIHSLAVSLDSRGFTDGVDIVESGIRRMEQATRSGFQRIAAIVVDGASRIRDLSRETKNVESTVNRWGEQSRKTAVDLMSLNTAMIFNANHSARVQKNLPGLVHGVGLLDERFGYLDRSLVIATDGMRLMADQQDRAVGKSRRFAQDTAAAQAAVQNFAESADSAVPRTQKIADAMGELGGSWGQMTETLQSNLNDFFFNVLDGADNVFEGIVKSWKRMIANMLAEAAVLKTREWFSGRSRPGGMAAPTSGLFQGAFANLPWIGRLFGGGQAGAYRGGISPNSNIWDIGAPSTGSGQASRPPFNATPYLAGGALASSMIPASAGGGLGGWLQGGMSGASMGSMAGPWGAIIGGILGSSYGGYQSGFYQSTLGKTNLWSSLLEGTPFGPIGMLGSFLGLPGIGGGNDEPANIRTSISGGGWDVRRHGEQAGVEWPASINRAIKEGILDFGVNFADMFSADFGDVLSGLDWNFETKATDWAGAVNETLANFIVDNWSTLFGGGAFLNADQLGMGMKGEGNIFEKFRREGETWSDTVLRMVRTMQGYIAFINETDQAIRLLTANDQGLTAFQYAAGQMEERIGSLKADIDEFAVESWERLDPTDVLERARELRATIIERYELEKSYVEGLVARLRDVQRAAYEFNLRLQTKIDALTGSTSAIGIAVDRVRDLWAEFQDTGDFERQVALLGELEQGLDTILSMQASVHQAEIDRLENVLAMLEQLRSASDAITEKIFSLTMQSESGYAQRAGYYWDRLMSTFREYQGMNWGQEETLEDRIRLVNEMAGWLDRTVNAVMARWEAHYDLLIASAQTEIESLEAQKRGIQEQIGDLNEEKRRIHESYRTQMDAIEEQIRAAEQWKRLSQSIADQILGMKLDWSNQQDIFERMDIARGEIERVQGLYAGAGSDEERIGYAGQLQSLYGDLLNLGQEAWQRPSPEYQSLYEEVLGGLEALQFDANANAGDTTALQAELNGLTESMNAELEAIDRRIEYLNEQTSSIDTQIAGHRSDIAGYEREKQAALSSIGRQAAEYYGYIQGEMTNLLELQADIEADLATEKEALSKLQGDFAGLYGDLLDAGSGIYTAQEQAIRNALRAVIGDRTVEAYLTDLATYTGTHLTWINDTMKDIAGSMGVPGYAEGGVAWHRQLAWVGEKEPESIVPFSFWEKIASAVGAQASPLDSARGYAGQAGGVNIQVTVAPKVTIEGGTSASPKDIGKAIVDVCVESVKRGRLRDVIKNEARYWK